MPVIKESSDELNPPVVTAASVAPVRRRRTPGDYLALALATCGVGLLPLAPGTWGSLVGVALYAGLQAASTRLFARAATGGHAPPLALLQTTLLLLVLTALTLAGVWAATRVERLLARKDPGAVVIDEVAGQLLTFAFVPYGGAWTLVVGFLAFRFFDITKPYPVRRLEALESGLGIMADDLLAGLYAAVLLAVTMTLRALF
ncbi:MAG TPA: phosphatidylglycerophosphatase A [Pyrinomonadaceae bacterium]|jgi:phosphatidylglycerophosphatase A